MGVKSTFFFKLHSEFYNLFEKEVLCKAQEIVELGHDVGLHFEYHFYNDSKKFQKNMIWEKKILEELLSIKVGVFSFDSPTLSDAINISNNKIGGMINTYGKKIKKKYHYCSDSNGYWRHERLFDLIKDEKYRFLHVLTHPGWWQKSVMSPKMRVMRCLNERSKRILETYDSILKETKRKNIK